MERKVKGLLAAVLGLVLAVSPAYAWQEPTHRQLVLDAIDFMKKNPDKTNYLKLLEGVTRGGYTIDQFASAVGQAATDVDHFTDTYLCGPTSGHCEFAPLWGATEHLVNYTTYWHFQNHTSGRDIHGNPFGGYNYSRLVVPGDVDRLAAVWLLGDYLDDGAGGMRGWFGDFSRFDTYHLTESHYRHQGLSTQRMYKDFHSMPFQPLDNVCQFWWQQFLARPTAQTLGFTLHATDLLQPHHTWTTSGNHHTGWERWVRDYYFREKLNDPALVSAALNDFTALAPDSVDIRPLLTQGGTWSYLNGGIVLVSTDHADRVQVGRSMIPHAIAMLVHILDRAAERLAETPQ